MTNEVTRDPTTGLWTQRTVGAEGDGSSGGLGLVDIPISTDETDWDNTAGAWVFNGDGTITSTAVSGEMTIPMPAEVAGIVMASRSVLKVDTLTTGEELGMYMLGIVNSPGDPFFVLSVLESGNNPTVDNPGAAGNSISPGVVTSDTGTFRANLSGASAVLFIDDTVVFGNVSPFTSTLQLDEFPQLLRVYTNGVAGSVVDLAGCSLAVASVA